MGVMDKLKKNSKIKTTDVLYNKCGNYLNWNNRKRIWL